MALLLWFDFKIKLCLIKVVQNMMILRSELADEVANENKQATNLSVEADLGTPNHLVGLNPYRLTFPRHFRREPQIGLRGIRDSSAPLEAEPCGYAD